MTRANSPIHSGQMLAPGEPILWKGCPSMFGTARDILRGDLLLAYFALLLAFSVARAVWAGDPLRVAAWPILPGLCAGTIVLLLARSIARSTTYIVTPRRIVLRFGAALPRHLSIPFSQVASLSLAMRGRGRGDIALRTRDDIGQSSFKLWPHVRGWQMRRPQPSLRDVPGAAVLATRLTRLLCEAEQARHVGAPAIAGEPEALRKAS